MWNLETRQVPVDRFVVKAGTYEDEAEALANIETDERVRFKRVKATVHVYVCSECGREHTAEIDDATGQPVEPTEPCDHVHGAVDKGPKQPWE